jgi:exodeoxyribonuclease V alpha subunit
VIELNEKQREAVELSKHSRLMILTGGPGTGKTTCLRTIVEEHGAGKVALAAPTGKAAKRLKEATGVEAKTIHRLLEYVPGTGEFQRGPGRPLDAELVIADEASMIDLRLMAALLRALHPKHGRLLLVGDGNQLPPIGPGSVLCDLLASGKVPAVSLTEVHRQAAESLIVRNAHHILHGEGLEVSGSPGGDFYWIEAPRPETCAQRLLEIVLEELPKHRKLDPVHSIQVLVPQRPGPLGADRLNADLGKALNPNAGPAISIQGRDFRAGDKVLQTRNNYRLNVFNGEWGVVQRVQEGRGLEVLLEDGRQLFYGLVDAAALIHSYAITVHRSQGSEYEAVVIPISSAHSMMLSRSLFYTAVTRGKRLVVVLGDRMGLRKALISDGARRRHTTLVSRLQAHEQLNGAA